MADESQMELLRITLQRDENNRKLGFSIFGGSDCIRGPDVVRVKNIFKSGLANKDGRLQEDDQLLSINGISLESSTHQEALDVIRGCRGDVIDLMIKRRIKLDKKEEKDGGGKKLCRFGGYRKDWLIEEDEEEDDDVEKLDTTLDNNVLYNSLSSQPLYSSRMFPKSSRTFDQDSGIFYADSDSFCGGSLEKKGLKTPTKISFCNYGNDLVKQQIMLNPVETENSMQYNNNNINNRVASNNNDNTTSYDKNNNNNFPNNNNNKNNNNQLPYTNANYNGLKRVVVNRLPGENLGIEVDVRRMVGGGGGLGGVFVSRVLEGGSADLNERKINVGDEIISINNKNLQKATHPEVVEILNALPLRVEMVLKSKEQTNTPKNAKSLDDVNEMKFKELYSNDNPPYNTKDIEYRDPTKTFYNNPFPANYKSSSGAYPLNNTYAMQSCKPCIIHEGYDVRRIAVKKRKEEKLGLEIEPINVQGSKYLKVSDILNDSVFARTNLVKKGDILISYNGVQLENTQRTFFEACIEDNGKSLEDVVVEVLREKESREGRLWGNLAGVDSGDVVSFRGRSALGDDGFVRLDGVRVLEDEIGDELEDCRNNNPSEYQGTNNTRGEYRTNNYEANKQKFDYNLMEDGQNVKNPLKNAQDSFILDQNNFSSNQYSHALPLNHEHPANTALSLSKTLSSSGILADYDMDKSSVNPSSSLSARDSSSNRNSISNGKGSIHKDNSIVSNKNDSTLLTDGPGKSWDYKRLWDGGSAQGSVANPSPIIGSRPRLGSDYSRSSTLPENENLKKYKNLREVKNENMKNKYFESLENSPIFKADYPLYDNKPLSTDDLKHTQNDSRRPSRSINGSYKSRYSGSVSASTSPTRSLGSKNNLDKSTLSLDQSSSINFSPLSYTTPSRSFVYSPFKTSNYRSFNRPFSASTLSISSHKAPPPFKIRPTSSLTYLSVHTEKKELDKFSSKDTLDDDSWLDENMLTFNEDEDSIENLHKFYPTPQRGQASPTQTHSIRQPQYNISDSPKPSQSNIVPSYSPKPNQYRDNTKSTSPTQLSRNYSPSQSNRTQCSEPNSNYTPTQISRTYSEREYNSPQRTVTNSHTLSAQTQSSLKDDKDHIELKFILHRKQIDTGLGHMVQVMNINTNDVRVIYTEKREEETDRYNLLPEGSFESDILLDGERAGFVSRTDSLTRRFKKPISTR